MSNIPEMFKFPPTEKNSQRIAIFIKLTSSWSFNAQMKLNSVSPPVSLKAERIE